MRLAFFTAAALASSVLAGTNALLTSSSSELNSPGPVRLRIAADSAPKSSLSNDLAPDGHFVVECTGLDNVVSNAQIQLAKIDPFVGIPDAKPIFQAQLALIDASTVEGGTPQALADARNFVGQVTVDTSANGSRNGGAGKTAKNNAARVKNAQGLLDQALALTQKCLAAGVGSDELLSTEASASSSTPAAASATLPAA